MNANRSSGSDVDVLVVGGGPAGSAVALPLARAGHRVVVVDAGAPPSSGSQVLTPLAVAALDQLHVPTHDFHRVDRVRVTAAGYSTSTRWPSNGADPRYGCIASRQGLDHTLAASLDDSGVTSLRGYTATGPIVERGFVRGARVVAPDATESEVRATYTVIADGAYSRFGRALGTYREPSWPHALAHVGSFSSELHAAPEIEIVPDLVDRAGTPVTGFGWLFPNGDGTVTVGIIMLSTSSSFQVINPATLFDRFVARQASRWRLDLESATGGHGGRIPMGLAVGPSAGPTYLLVGDAAGAANPLSGAGIEAALTSGQIASRIIANAIDTGDAAALQQYPHELAECYGTYYKIGRVTDRLIGQPAVATRIALLAARYRGITDTFVRISTGQFRAGHLGFPEMLYRFARAGSILAPDA